MPKVVKINSGKGLVEFKREELADLDLLKWVRSDSKGWGNRHFIAVQPIEKAAAAAYKEEYPAEQVKIAEKCFLGQDGTVQVILRVAEELSEGLYNHHPTKLTFNGSVKNKSSVETIPQSTFEEVQEKKKKSGLVLPIDFIEANINKMSDDEKRQIYAELDQENADAFLEDLKLAMIDQEVDIDKIATELGYEIDDLISE